MDARKTLPLLGVVLAGGRSTRMGRAKADLPFGGETLLERVVHLVQDGVDRVVIVAAADQSLAPWTEQFTVVRDRRPDRGPLEGIAAGLRAIPKDAAAFITACDAPLLAPQIIGLLARRLEDFDAVVPVETTARGERHYPLSAIYRRRVLGTVETMLAADCLRAADLLDRVNCRRVRIEELREADPDLRSLKNVNTPADYEAALLQAGFALPTSGHDAN